jgi:hypothetical protein
LLEPQNFATEDEPILGEVKQITPESVLILKEWLMGNLSRPYASKTDMIELSQKSGLTVYQTQRWLSNARCRVWFKKSKLLKQ